MPQGSHLANFQPYLVVKIDDKRAPQKNGWNLALESSNLKIWAVILGPTPQERMGKINSPYKKKYDPSSWVPGWVPNQLSLSLPNILRDPPAVPQKLRIASGSYSHTTGRWLLHSNSLTLNILPVRFIPSSWMR
jgi:hypothetical protein